MVLKKSNERLSATAAAGETKKGKTAKGMGGIRKKNLVQETYSVYIYRVLKQVHPEIGISKRTMSIMNSFINDVFERLCVEAGNLVG